MGTEERLDECRLCWIYSYYPIIKANKEAYIKGMPCMYYQYRSFDNFWKIIDSDVLWARNIRFSNDKQEQRQGQKLVFKNGQVETEDDYYMICFSDNSDSLSQWRAYAGKGGVAIGFDFKSLEKYSLISEEKLESADGDASQTVLVRPCKVLYLDQTGKDKNRVDIINELLIDATCKPDSESHIPNTSVIPYIKNIGFIEESEWRIVINKDMNVIEDDMKKYIRYDEGETKNIPNRRPYIVLAAGIKEYDKKTAVVRLQLAKRTLYKQLITNVEDSVGKDKVIECRLNGNADMCFGCTQVLDMKIDVGEASKRFCRKGPNEIKCCGRFEGQVSAYSSLCQQIVISQGEGQADMFEKIYAIVSEFNAKLKKKASAEDYEKKRVKVWCEGHLPIREIVIGPCDRQEEMSESIKHYLKNSEKYWLRDVEVKKSNIPYRQPIE